MIIDVDFDDRRLKRDCATDGAGQRRFGRLWPVIKRRLATLKGAPTLAALRGAPGGCHELSQDRQGSLAMTLSGNWRIQFRPDNDPRPLDPQGSLIWDKVTAVRIEEVVDYHGS